MYILSQNYVSNLNNSAITQIKQIVSQWDLSSGDISYKIGYEHLEVLLVYLNVPYMSLCW